MMEFIKYVGNYYGLLFRYCYTKKCESLSGGIEMNKTALITGATSGLGYEFVKRFANDHYHLVLVARNNTKLLEIKQSFPHIKVTTIQKDLSIPGAASDIFEYLTSHNIQIDALVNNAGFGSLGLFDELDIDEQLRMIQVNVMALTELTYYLLPQMKQRKSGRIMNVASTAAFQPGPLMAVYYATKGYVLSFSEALVDELSGMNVTVTTLCPGPTQTNFSTAANMKENKMFGLPMDASFVAKKGYQAFMKGKRVSIPGSLNKLGVLGVKYIPRSIASKLSKYISAKK